jgi:hypothetical protein
LNAGIIVAAKANQNPPIYTYERSNRNFQNIVKLTDGTEHNTGKSIAEYEFKNTGDKQQQAAEENDRSASFLLRRWPVDNFVRISLT